MRDLITKVKRLFSLREEIEALQEEERTLRNELAKELGPGVHKVGPYKIRIEKVTRISPTDYDELIGTPLERYLHTKIAFDARPLAKMYKEDPQALLNDPLIKPLIEKGVLAIDESFRIKKLD